MTKFIFVTGGVVSGLGKGIVAASLGRLLKSAGYSVAVEKFDPYMNIDPGTLNPVQHGEVFVTADGAETDLDLGHYERFIGVNLTKDSSLTSGKLYSTVLKKERAGEYGGKTVQIVPHVTNEIKNHIRLVAKKSGADIVITEIGASSASKRAMETARSYTSACYRISLRRANSNPNPCSTPCANCRAAASVRTSSFSVPIRRPKRTSLPKFRCSARCRKAP